MSKDDKLFFIKYFANINISSLCKELNIDISNLYHEKCSNEKVDLIFNKLLDEINNLYNFIGKT